MVSNINLQVSLLGKGKKVKAGMGRFAVFHCRKEEGSLQNEPKILPILYSKNLNDVVVSNQVKAFLEDEDCEEEFYLNSICDRIINKKTFLNSVLEEESELSLNKSKFVNFTMNECYKDEENKIFKE